MRDIGDTAPGPTEAATDHGIGRRRAWVGLGLIAMVLVAELGVRAIDDRLPEPQRWSTPETQFKVAQMEAVLHVDAVVVGSSVTDVSVDPRRLEGPTYNASLGAASMGMISAFTLAVVVPELDPDLVVVGIASRELNANTPGLSDIEDRFFDAPAVRHLLGTETVLDRLDRVLGDVSALVRYRSVLRDPDNLIDPRAPWDETLTRSDGFYLGFLDQTYEGGTQALARMRNGALHDFEIGDEELGELARLLEELDSQGRRVLLVATPVTQGYVDQYPRGAADHDTFLATVARVADELDVGFVAAGVWDEALMADPLHANAAGSARLTDLVARALAETSA